MPLETFPDYPLSVGSQPQARARVLEKRLGDGYTQAAADGLNAIAITFRAEFKARPIADIRTIHDFLIRHGGHTPFFFTLPDEAAPRKWRCKTWRGPTRVSAALRALTATFEEDFSL